MENALSPRIVLDIGIGLCIMHIEKKIKQKPDIYPDTTNSQVGLVDVARRLLIKHFCIQIIILAEVL